MSYSTRVVVGRWRSCGRGGAGRDGHRPTETAQPPRSRATRRLSVISRAVAEARTCYDCIFSFPSSESESCTPHYTLSRKTADVKQAFSKCFKKILSCFPRFKHLTEILKRFYYGDVSINVTHNDIFNDILHYFLRYAK